MNIIKEENFKWHLEAFASELFIYIYIYRCVCIYETKRSSVIATLHIQNKNVHKKWCRMKQL